MFLKSKKVGLRQIEENDLARLRDWRNLPEIRSRTREFAPLNMLNQRRWWESLTDKRNIMLGIYPLESVGEILIGVCGLVHIDWKNRSSEFSYYIGEEKYRGKGFGREVSYLLLEYGFSELGLHRIWAEVYESASEILKIDERLGFKCEGIMRDSYWNEGRWWNSYILSILNSEWEIVRGK